MSIKYIKSKKFYNTLLKLYNIIFVKLVFLDEKIKGKSSNL